MHLAMQAAEAAHLTLMPAGNQRFDRFGPKDGVQNNLRLELLTISAAPQALQGARHRRMHPAHDGKCLQQEEANRRKDQPLKAFGRQNVAHSTAKVLLDPAAAESAPRKLPGQDVSCT
jgi:hypothetical protein